MKKTQYYICRPKGFDPKPCGEFVKVDGVKVVIPGYEQFEMFKWKEEDKSHRQISDAKTGYRIDSKKLIGLRKVTAARYKNKQQKAIKATGVSPWWKERENYITKERK